MNVFKQKNYRDLIRDATKRSGLSFRQVAQSSKIHASYFSRVMQGQAEFSAEQLYRICQKIGFEDHETEFALLLGELSRSSFHEHQRFIKQRIAALQAEQMRLIEQLTGVDRKLSSEAVELYYKETLTAEVHMLLTIPSYANKPTAIANRLSISRQVLQQQMDRLEQLGILEQQPNASVRLKKSSIHLDDQHPISRQNHVNWRIKNLHRLNQAEGLSSDYHLSACFTSDESTKREVKELLKEAIVKAQRLIAKSEGSEDLCYVSLDLYS